MSMFDDRNTEAGRTWTHFWYYAFWIACAAIVLALSLSPVRAATEAEELMVPVVADPKTCVTADGIEADFDELVKSGSVTYSFVNRYDYAEDAVERFFELTQGFINRPDGALDGVSLYNFDNGTTLVVAFRDGCLEAWIFKNTKTLAAVLGEGDSGLDAPGGDYGGRPPATFGTDPNANPGPRSEYDA
jgi:hypothetical protein